MTEVKWDHDGTKTTEGEVLGLLYALVRTTKPEICVETGTFTGMGTQAISGALVQNDYGHLTTVENDEEAYRQYPSLPRTTFVLDDSLEFAEDFASPIDFAFVDCGDPEHRLAVAIELYNRLTRDGLLLVHDTVFYEGFLDGLVFELGEPGLELRTLHGLAVWQVR